MLNNSLARNIKSLFAEKYVVPLYQRNFTWGKGEIEQLIQDIYDSYELNPNGNYYIGTLVVIRRRNESVFEVIDGQQRLTVLSLVSKLLGIVRESVLTYDSRPEVEDFFKDFYANKKVFQEIPQTENLRAALSHIENVEVFTKKQNEKLDKIRLFDRDSNDLDEFIKFLGEHVIIIFEEMPEDTDVAAYFEIMNNRGEQLQKHEILKAKFISQIQKEDPSKQKQKMFAKVWDACVRMDIPIQRMFDAGERKALFGENYDGFRCDWDMWCDLIKERKDETDEEDTDDSEFGSIIDFPNFLMHVLKIYRIKNAENGEYIPIPLNEKNMPTDGWLDNPMEFARKMLYYRVVLDRFIVKTNTKKNEDTDWVLYSTYKDGKGSLRVDLRTFKEKYLEMNPLEIDDLQDRIIKALSMLQVTFRQRINKNWLQDLLIWFDKKYDNGFIDLNHISAKEYLQEIESIILNYFNEKIISVFDYQNENWEFKIKRGESTPHFLFNFIDYLYWVDIIYNRNKRNVFSDITIDSNSKIVDDFSFKYYNSVEHHYPQNPENEDDKMEDVTILNNLGNLYLISKGINSKMSNQMPIAKMSYKSENPNRRIIYYLTNKVGCWNKETILGHYKDLIELLKNREEILKLQ